MYRTRTNGELRIKNVGEMVTLAGWVSKKRNFGNLVFVDLRDRYGITQLVFSSDFAEQLSNVRNEYVIQVNGKVVERQSKNPNLPTGDIEIEVKEVKVRYKIDTHDYQVRINNIKKFISQGNKVKIVIMLRGREMQHSELAFELANRFIEDLKNEPLNIEKKPMLEGRNVTLYLGPQ